MRRVRELVALGLNAREVSAETGVPQTTVGRWARGETAAFGPAVVRRPWRPPDAWTYAYLLGLYLGDGHVFVRPSGSAWLRVYLDGAYPGIVEDCATAIVLTTMGGRVTVRRAKGNRVNIVHSAWKRWPEVFPQHGPGRKHERRIVLEAWQRAVVEAQPRPFLRGLIHSDGCRSVNRFRTRLPSGRLAEYAYPRYFFSNLSPEIRALFCDACGRLGIRTTQSNPRNVSVSHRHSVAVLEELVGPKA